MTGIQHPDLANAPKDFVRLVYCLGYGESDFVGHHIHKNSGTWQYWKLFTSCVHAPTFAAFEPYLKKSTPSFDERIHAKIKLLGQLRELGVWLLDASIFALYAPGGSSLHVKTYERILRLCWEHYIGPSIQNAAPHSVIVIGRRVHSALQSELRALSNVELHTVPQPAAHISSQEINEMHQCIHRVCQQAAISRGGQ